MFLRLHLAIIIILLVSCKEKVAENKQSQQPPIIPAVNNTMSDKSRSVLDKSPMDMIYLPEDYPVLKMSGKIKDLPVARVIYSRPIKEGRSIFGNVVKYGSYWRLGANESTEIEFFRDVIVAGQKVKKGRYIIYCVPSKDKWTIRLNNDLYTWGLKVHDLGDMYSFDIPVTILPREYDVFTMQFAEGKDNNTAELLMAWDNVKAALPIRY
jgi:hypothetical protein